MEKRKLTSRTEVTALMNVYTIQKSLANMLSLLHGVQHKYPTVLSKSKLHQLLMLLRFLLMDLAWKKVTVVQSIFVNFYILFLMVVFTICPGVTNKPCHFTVETKGAGIDSLGFAIEGPAQAEIKCVDKGDGMCDVTYYPTLPGKYAVHVTCGDVDINKSPFMVPISPAGDASKVYAEGPGLEPQGVCAGMVLTKREVSSSGKYQDAEGKLIIVSKCKSMILRK